MTTGSARTPQTSNIFIPVATTAQASAYATGQSIPLAFFVTSTNSIWIWNLNQLIQL